MPVINVPEWNVRTTLALTTDMFKKALHVQTGVTGQYFTGFYADQYNPLLGDFMRQDQQQIGDYPRVDVFFNGKIRQARFISAMNMPMLPLLDTTITVPLVTLTAIVSCVLV